MAEKGFYTNNKNFKVVHDQLIIKYDSATVDSIWQKANAEYASLEQAYSDAPKGQKMHLSAIFSLLAVYKVLKEESPEDALEIISEQSKSQALEGRKKMLKVSNAFPRLFVFLCRTIAKNSFGEEAGFKLEFIPAKKNECRFDITQCPYFKVCTELGCPELASVFCERDVYAYAHLPKVDFRRSGTIANGAERCDFLYSVKDLKGSSKRN